MEKWIIPVLLISGVEVMKPAPGWSDLSSVVIGHSPPFLCLFGGVRCNSYRKIINGKKFYQKVYVWLKTCRRIYCLYIFEVIFNTTIKNLVSVSSNPVVSLMSCYEKFNISKPYIPKQELNPAPLPYSTWPWQ